MAAWIADQAWMRRAGQSVGGALLALHSSPGELHHQNMTTTPTAAGPPPPGDQPDRATRAAAGRVLTRDAANTWLTDATVADIGQAVAISISHYRRIHQQQPTWAQALAGVDPELLTLTVLPPGWTLPPAVLRLTL